MQLKENILALRSYGSCALDMCHVACGRLDISFECTGIKSWDYAAGTAIVQHAGGSVVCGAWLGVYVRPHQAD
jgi:myo-inositol-1(or 4)-monophosphatase